MAQSHHHIISPVILMLFHRWSIQWTRPWLRSAKWPNIETFVCLEYLHWYESSIGMFLRTVHSSNVGSFTTGNLTLDSELLTPLASAMLRISSVCCLNNLVSMSLLLLDVYDSLCCRLNFCMSSPCYYTRANISLPIDERDSACWIDAFVHRFSLIFISKYLSLNAILSSTFAIIGSLSDAVYFVFWKSLWISSSLAMYTFSSSRLTWMMLFGLIDFRLEPWLGLAKLRDLALFF